MDRFTRWRKPALAGLAGVLAALGVATSLTQAASKATTTPTATTPTTTTKTTPTTTTPTTTTPKPKPAPKATTRQIKCRANLVATKPLSDSAENFGTVSCSVPLGQGLHHDTSTVTRTSSTAGSFAGGLKLFYNTGTLRGTYKMSFTVLNKTLNYDGTLKISSGTGEFAGVKGKGTIAGTSSDGVHSTITETMTLTFPPKKTT
ncbi:MAG: hypothetical protein QOJ85_651 [Solirubrobacteraceae bacterium]|nr:hypothetical protein [Solirubrobacteraceae bacterium]